MFPCTIKKGSLSFSSFLFNSFLNDLNIFMAFVAFKVLHSFSIGLVISMGNCLLRVVSGIFPAIFFKICSHIFMIFEVKLE